MKNFELSIALANVLPARPLYISFWAQDAECIPIRSVVATEEKTTLIGGDAREKDKNILTVAGLRIVLATAKKGKPVFLRPNANSKEELKLDFVSVRNNETGVYFRAEKGLD